MGVRIALQCSEADSRLIFADDNPSARTLSRPGQAIYNDDGGKYDSNREFQVAWLPDDKRDAYLDKIQAMAQQRQYIPPQPQIIFEGNAPAEVEKNRALHDLLAGARPATTPRVAGAWLGEPVDMRESLAANFRRQSGSNLLIVGQNDAAAMGMMAVALISLAAQHAPSPDSGEGRGGGYPFYILDFGAVDTPYADFFNRLTEQIPYAIKLGRRRQLPDILSELANEVQRRIDADDTGAPAKYLFVYGLHRARDIQEDEMFLAPSRSNEPVTLNLSQQLATILREGPDVGVHTTVWCDTRDNLNRRLNRDAAREFAMKVAFQMSPDDSASLIDTPAASKLGSQRAFFYNEEEGRLDKFRPYGLPSETWLTWVGERLKAKTSM